VNDTVFLHGRVTYVGNTSMEVRVDAYTEGLDGERKPVNTAFFTMVALDENEKPVRVPRLLIESDQEKRYWDAAKERKEIRNRARQ
jgi:acyl-CoA hydrolase